MKLAICTITALILSACTSHKIEPVMASIEQIDKISRSVEYCPGMRAVLAESLSDDKITFQELKAIVRRNRALAMESERLDSYGEARKAAGLAPRKRGHKCLKTDVTDLWVIV